MNSPEEKRRAWLSEQGYTESQIDDIMEIDKPSDDDDE